MSSGGVSVPHRQSAFPSSLRGFALGAAILLVWLLVWMRLSWPYSLDDALIHLRYADHLLHQHRITYNGLSPSFGTSSLLFVGLLALLRDVWTSPMLPRTVSSIVHAAVFLLLTRTLWVSLRRGEERRGLRVLLSVALLTVLVAPSAIRWMDDGMETSLTFLDAIAGAVLLRHLCYMPAAKLRISAVLFGLLTVLLRVEMLLLPAVISLSALLGAWLPRTGDASLPIAARRGRVADAVLPVAGALVGAALIVGWMHALLPDTALAKAFGAGAWRDTVHMAEITMASSFSFGLGLLLLWLLSAFALLLGRGASVSDLVPNLLFPTVLVAAIARGQAIQGIRYFAWTLFFSLLWNLLRLGDVQGVIAPHGDRLLRIVTAVLLLGLLPAFAWESATFFPLFRGRGEAFDRFRAQPALARLRGMEGVAEDVGFVGYFTGGDICDPYGLVNGRAAARMTYPQRFDRCMARHPVFVFGSEGFLHKVDFHTPLRSWLLCGTYNFENVRSHDVHYLLVAPQGSAACPKSLPLDQALPGLL